MRKKYQLRTTVPSWIFLGLAIMLYAMYWVEMIRQISSDPGSIIFYVFSVTVPFYVSLAVNLIPYLFWLVILIIGKRIKNPFVPLIVYFAYGLLLAIPSLVRTVLTVSGLIWINYATIALNLLFFLIPCLLNSIFWRKKWVYIVGAVAALLNHAMDIAAYVYLMSRAVSIFEKNYRLANVFSAVSGVFMILCWLLYALMIRRVPAGEAAGAPVGVPISGQDAALRNFPPYAAPGMAQYPSAPACSAPMNQVPTYAVPPMAQDQIPPQQIPVSQLPPQPAEAAPCRPPEAQAPDQTPPEPTPLPAPEIEIPVPQQPPQPAEAASFSPREAEAPVQAPAAPAWEGPRKYFCMNCGMELPAHAKFCSRCGTKVPKLPV